LAEILFQNQARLKHNLYCNTHQ